MTIACHLVKESRHPELLGDTADSRAVVQQWLEYRVTKLDNYAKDDIKSILKVEKERCCVKAVVLKFGGVGGTRPPGGRG